MKVSIIILKLLFIGALFIVSNQNLHLADDSEREMFVEDYTTWLDGIVEHGVEVTAFVVKFEWLPPRDGVNPERPLREPLRSS